MKPNTTCQTCKKSFRVRPCILKKGGGKYCSRECRKTSIEVACLFCDKRFKAQPYMLKIGEGKYCSRSCKAKDKTGPAAANWKGGKTSFICKQCDNSFKGNPSQAPKFCSRRCHYDHRSATLYGDKCYQWKGGECPNAAGYIRQYTHKDYRYQHRLVAEEALGRSLEDHEVIHHIDNDPANNDPENLYLFESSAAHTRYHGEARNGRCDEITESNLF